MRSPKAHRVRASSLAEQDTSGVVPPNEIPVPSQLPPPETEPRQVSIPAAARPGANTVGTVVIFWLAGTELMTLVVVVLLGELALLPTAAFPP